MTAAGIVLLVLGFIGAYAALMHAHTGDASSELVRDVAVPAAAIAIVSGAALQLVGGCSHPK